MIEVYSDETAFPLFKATRKSSAFDLRSNVDEVIGGSQRKTITTGVYLKMEGNNAALVVPRSGLALKHGITVLNGPGLIDTDYEGEIKVILFNSDFSPFNINKGDRISQLMFIQTLNSNQNINFKMDIEFKDEERGSRGFGSSGV